MRKKIFITLLILSIILTLITSCTNPQQSNNDTVIPTIRLGLMPDTAGLPYLIANELGYYDNVGINIEIEVFKSAIERDMALQAGKLDAISSDLVSVGFFKQSDLELVITSITEAEYKIVSAPDSNIDSIDELNNKQIGLSFNTLMEFLLDMALESANISPDDIIKTSIPKIPNRLEMLKNNQIDAATLPEPLATATLIDGSKEIISNVDFAIQPGVILFTKKYAEANSDIVSSFYQGYNEAIEYINSTNLTEFKDILVEKLSFPEKTIDYIELNDYHKAQLPSNNDVHKAMEWLLNKELITKEYSYEELTINLLK